MGIAHFDDAPARDFEIGHLRAHWTLLGEAAGSVAAGVRRIQLPAGGWSTPAHEHGADEEIFFVLAGRGFSWQNGKTAEIAQGDCIVYLAGGGAHTLHAVEPLDVLAFGTRSRGEGIGFPRLGMSLLGRRAAETIPGAVDGAPFQFVREGKLGPPELPEPTERPSTIVSLPEVEARQFGRGPVSATRRNLGRAAGSRRTGLQHCHVDPEMNSAPAHCHSLEEEIFVVLGGDGHVVLGEEQTPVRPGHVIARPAGTGVAHAFVAGLGGLEYLAYGTREPGDMCYYPRSGNVAFRGLGLVARVQRVDYWDGED